MTLVGSGEGWKRLRTDVAPDVCQELQHLADKDGLTITDVIARGASTYRLVREAVIHWPDVELHIKKADRT